MSATPDSKANQETTSPSFTVFTFSASTSPLLQPVPASVSSSSILRPLRERLVARQVPLDRSADAAFADLLGLYGRGSQREGQEQEMAVLRHRVHLPSCAGAAG
jgi:hypothetical protein